MSLTQKKIIVIGGTSGFGKAVALEAAKLGAQVSITGRDAAKLKQVVTAFQQAGHNVSGHSLDVGNVATLEPFFEETGSFDHLVSMAGGFMGGGFLGADYATIRRAIDEKLFANLLIARHAAPKIAAGGSMTFTAGSGGHAYDASGAFLGNQAISTMIQGLAVELAPRARVNAVAPTWTDTGLWRGMAVADVAATKARFAEMIPLGRTAEIAEVASVYLFLMQNGFITGQTITVDGGLSLKA